VILYTIMSSQEAKKKTLEEMIKILPDDMIKEIKGRTKLILLKTHGNNQAVRNKAIIKAIIKDY